MKTAFKRHACFIVIASLFFITGLLRLNDLSLYTDCTRYLIWGNSVAHCKGFVDDTQPEPQYFIVNAPLFAVILAPALVFFPLSLIAAKIWTLLWGILALLLFYLWLRNHFDQIPALAATLFLALNPLTLVFSTEVLSETSFLCALFGIFIIFDRIDIGEHNHRSIIVLVAIISLITLLREVGASLAAVAILFLFFRKQWRIALLAFIGAAALFALWTYRNLGMAGTLESSQNPNLIFIFQNFVTAPDATLLHEITQRILINFNSYFPGFGGMLLYPSPNNLITNPSKLFLLTATILNFIRHYLFIIFIPALLFGIILDFKHSQTAFFRFLFVVIYVCIILIYPVQDVRFLFPLLPFALYYLTGTIASALSRGRFSSSTRRLLITAALVLALLPDGIYLCEIIQTNFHYLKDPIAFSTGEEAPSHNTAYFSTPWQSMGTWIDRVIPQGSIIATPNKEIVPFAPKEKFLELNRAVPLPFFETILRDNAAGYLLAPAVYYNITEYHTLITESKRFRFEQLLSMNHLIIFRVHSRLEELTCDSVKLRLSIISENTTDSLLLGRIALNHEKYPEALSSFSRLHCLYPHRADIIYQLFLVHAFMLDSANAVLDLQNLYVSPNSTSYMSQAQTHLSVMLAHLHAISLHDPARSAEELFELAQLYWKLGYPRQAYRMIRHTIELDTAYFAGYLWAWHFGIQAGDTIHAKECLNRLELIDRENPVVKSFKKIESYQESLRQISNPEKRSNLHLALSHEYHAIDLPDESLDEAQRAIGESPANTDAWHYLAGLFEGRNCHIAARRALQKAAELEVKSAANSNMPLTKK